MQDRNPSSEIWTGKRLGVDGAKQMLGFNSVYKGIDLKEFGLNWSTLYEVMVIYPNQPNHSPLANAELGDLVDYFQEATKKSKVVVNESGLKSMMNTLREIKTKEEIVLMQKAMDITIDGFKAMIKQLEPGMSEYEAQAIIEYYSKKGGSEYMGYPSICGGGSNACVLHYTYNRKSLEAKICFWSTWVPSITDTPQILRERFLSMEIFQRKKKPFII
ncbi:MAG: M24 family metallopeptidase [Bacteroidetes bacterium]|nr:M24 family metallopeptidase [Bacteroidota bacterium]